MDFSSTLPTFVITLREGVEAALVVGIVLAYLKKARRRDLNSYVYGGVAVGLIASALVGVFFGWIVQTLETNNQPYAPVIEPLFEGVFSLMAIAMLSWMLIWMTQNARQMKQTVESAIESSLDRRSRAGWGIFGLVFFAVLREGFETVLFIAAKFQQGFVPALGAFAGIAVAAGIGGLIFRWGMKLNLRKFFMIVGTLLLLIIAGLVVTALARFDAAVSALSQMNRQTESLCFFYERFAKPQDRDCILGPMVWNTSKILPEDRFPGVVLNVLFGYTQRLYLVQALSYSIFLITVGSIYLQSLNGWVIFSFQKSRSPARKK